MQNWIGLVGIVVLVAGAWCISEYRRGFPWRLVVAGVVVQAAVGFLLLRFEPAVWVFGEIAAVINGVISQADAGIAFLFGIGVSDPGGPWGFIFAVRVLPVIVFFASLSAVLYHWGVMQRVIVGLAWALRSTLRVTGTEALAVAANVFLGQTEAPLSIRPYVEKLSRSQLATVMVGGFATIAGSVLGGYVVLLGGGDELLRESFVKHFLTASVMSAPAAFVLSKILVPERGEAFDAGLGTQRSGEMYSGALDAAAGGAADGLKLALNVAAMLVAFVSLLAFVNWPIGAIGDIPAVASWREANGIGAFSLQGGIGVLLSPVAFLTGVPWSEAGLVGTLLGEKIIATEFIAYGSLQEMQASGALSDRSVLLATYALCGFANIPSIAIQIGGLTGMAPSRRGEIASLGPRAMIGGVLASLMTACIAGLYL